MALEYRTGGHEGITSSRVALFASLKTTARRVQAPSATSRGGFVSTRNSRDLSSSTRPLMDGMTTGMPHTVADRRTTAALSSLMPSQTHSTDVTCDIKSQGSKLLRSDSEKMAQSVEEKLSLRIRQERDPTNKSEALTCTRRPFRQDASSRRTFHGWHGSLTRIDATYLRYASRSSRPSSAASTIQSAGLRDDLLRISTSTSTVDIPAGMYLLKKPRRDVSSPFSSIVLEQLKEALSISSPRAFHTTDVDSVTCSTVRSPRRSSKTRTSSAVATCRFRAIAVCSTNTHSTIAPRIVSTWAGSEKSVSESG